LATFSTQGTTYGSYEGRYMYLTVTETTVDKKNNKSLLSWTLTVTGGSVNYYSTGPTTVKINGTQVYYKARTEWDERVFPAARGSVSGTIEVQHDTNGSKTIPIVLQTAVYYGSWAVADYGGSMTLTAIDRTSPTVQATATVQSSTSIKIKGTASKSCNKWEYTLNGGTTWTTYSTTDGTSAEKTLTGLTSQNYTGMEGHIGVYVGDGLAVECTPKWENKVQITACNCSKSGYNRRNWTKHGKLPYIDYVATDTPVAPPAPATEKKSVEEIAKEVINGLWGNGEERKQKLTAAGYDYSTVQAKVNEMLAPKPATEPSKSIDDLAKEVINGDWGNGADRKNRLTAAGYDYAKVQARVNELCAAATPKPAEVYVPKKGDIVNFKGNKHYSNANATSGYYCKPGKAKITQDPYKVGKSKHPYHLVAVSGGGSNVYGWVDAGTFEKA